MVATMASCLYLVCEYYAKTRDTKQAVERKARGDQGKSRSVEKKLLGESGI